MKRVLGVLLSGVLLSGVLAGTALAEGDVTVAGSVDGCVEVDHGTATINVVMENLTDGQLHMWVEFSNRSTSASPPFWKYPPWYSLQEFYLEGYQTAVASWGVGPDTVELNYRYWVVTAWVNSPFSSGNVRYYEGYVYIPECPPTKAEQLIDSGVPGKGLIHAPGLDKPFRGAAAKHAGMK